MMGKWRERLKEWTEISSEIVRANSEVRVIRHTMNDKYAPRVEMTYWELILRLMQGD